MLARAFNFNSLGDILIQSVETCNNIHRLKSMVKYIRYIDFPLGNLTILVCKVTWRNFTILTEPHM